MNIIFAVVIPVFIFILVSLTPCVCELVHQKKKNIIALKNANDKVIAKIQTDETAIDSVTTDFKRINIEPAKELINDKCAKVTILEERIYVDKPRIIYQRIIRDGEEHIVLKI